MSNNFLARQIVKAGNNFFVKASITILTLCPIVLTAVPARADVTYTADIQKEAVDDLKRINERGLTPKTIAFTPNGGYVILYGKNGVAYSTNKIPPDALNVLATLNKQDSTINTIAFAPNGEWIVMYDYFKAYWSKNFPQEIVNTLSKIKRQVFIVNNIVFTPNGAWTIIADNLNGSQVYWSSNLSQNVIVQIKEISQKYAIKDIAFTPNGGWLIIYNRGNNAFYNNKVPQLLIDTIKTKYKQGKRLTDIAFTPSNGWVLLDDKSMPPSIPRIPSLDEFPAPIIIPQ